MLSLSLALSSSALVATTLLPFVSCCGTNTKAVVWSMVRTTSVPTRRGDLVYIERGEQPRSPFQTSPFGRFWETKLDSPILPNVRSSLSVSLSLTHTHSHSFLLSEGRGRVPRCTDSQTKPCQPMQVVPASKNTSSHSRTTRWVESSHPEKFGRGFPWRELSLITPLQSCAYGEDDDRVIERERQLRGTRNARAVAVGRHPSKMTPPRSCSCAARTKS